MLVVGSEILGVFTGACFYRLFLKSVPPLMLSSINQGASHAMFLVYGGMLGIAIAVWSLAVIPLSRLFKARTPAV